MKKRRQLTIVELKQEYDKAIHARRIRLYEAIQLSKAIAIRQGVLIGGLTPEPPVEAGSKPQRLLRLYRQQDP